jgi:hypothetical protein
VRAIDKAALVGFFPVIAVGDGFLGAQFAAASVAGVQVIEQVGFKAGLMGAEGAAAALPDRLAGSNNSGLIRAGAGRERVPVLCPM